MICWQAKRREDGGIVKRQVPVLGRLNVARVVKIDTEPCTESEVSALEIDVGNLPRNCCELRICVRKVCSI